MKIPLKELRERSKITQSDLSKRMNVAASTVGLWEQGRREPNYDTLNRIADLFQVSTDYLLGRESSGLSVEEKRLLSDYQALTAEGKQTLRNVLRSLKISEGQ